MSVTARNLFFAIAAVFFIGYGCKTVEKSTSEQDTTTKTDTALTNAKESDALVSLLNDTRNSLGDVYLTQQHDMPEAFTRKDSADAAVTSNPFAGYRIQLLSSRSKQLADSIAGSYRIWSDTTLAGYQAPVYQIFRQPYYRVQIGDFHLRERANNFSKLIKKQFPDAWVVHQRINPEQVPADTIEFKFRPEKPDSVLRIDSTGAFNNRP